MILAVLFFGLLAAGASTALFVPAVSRLALKKGWVDKPDEVRKFHAIATPNVGGLAIAAGFAVGLAFLLAVKHLLPMELPLPTFTVWLGALAMVGLGFYDDVRGAGFKTKLFVQVIIAYVLIHAGYRIDVSHLPFVGSDLYEQALFSIPLTLLWIVGIMNAVNLVDGADGLAAGIAAIAFVCFACIFGTSGEVGLALLAVPLAGALAGFLMYNFNPASIFMGDSGSLFLGYMLAVYSLQAQPALDPLVGTILPIVVLGLPVLDTGLAIVRRTAGGKAICAPDSDHIHHRLMRSYPVRRAVTMLYGIALLFGITAVFMAAATPAHAYLLLLGAMGLSFAGVRWLGYTPVHDFFRKSLHEEALAVEGLGLAWGDVMDGRSNIKVEVERMADLESDFEMQFSSDGGSNQHVAVVSVSGLGPQDSVSTVAAGTGTVQVNMKQQMPREMGAANLSEESTVVANEGITLADLGGEAILLDTQSGKYFGLNELGTTILAMVSRPVRVWNMLHELEGQYDVASERLRTDVLNFLSEMSSADLLRVVPEGELMPAESV